MPLTSISANAGPNTPATVSPRGRFITLEGIDGAGKSTHLNFLADSVRASGVAVTLTREPGGTQLGETLREMLLHQNMHQDTEALLMFAGRSEHLAQVIRPRLAAGEWVICDRFTDATYAYQGGGRGMAPTRLAALEQFVHGDLQPDLTILFDLHPDIAQSRREQARTPDRFEAEQAAFFIRVRDAYLARAAQSPERFLLIDGAQSIEAICVQLSAALSRQYEASA